MLAIALALCMLHVSGTGHHRRIRGEPPCCEASSSTGLLENHAKPSENGARSEITARSDFVSGPNVLHKYRSAKGV